MRIPTILWPGNCKENLEMPKEPPIKTKPSERALTPARTRRALARLAALRGTASRAITDLPIRKRQLSDVRTPDGRSREEAQKTQPINAFGEQTPTRLPSPRRGKPRAA